MSAKPQFIELTCLVHGKSSFRIKEITSAVPLSDEDFGTRVTLYNGSVYRVAEDYADIRPYIPSLIRIGDEVPEAA